MSMPCCLATASIRARGPTRIGAIRPSCAASTAPRSELSSQGCATAVGVGGSALQKSSSRWYFSCVRSIVHSLALRAVRLPADLRGLRRTGAATRRRGVDRQRLADVLDHRELLASTASYAARARRRAAAAPASRSSLAIARSRKQLRQRGERLLGLVAHDDLLLAADAAPLIRRHRGQQIARSRPSAPASAAAATAAAARPCARAGTRRARAPRHSRLRRSTPAPP